MIAPYTFPAHQNILLTILFLFNILRFALVHGIIGICNEGDYQCLVDICVFWHFLGFPLPQAVEGRYPRSGEIYSVCSCSPGRRHCNKLGTQVCYKQRHAVLAYSTAL